MASRLLLLALCLTVVLVSVAGQDPEPACTGAMAKRSRDFQGGAISQNTSLILTPPPNQAVLPPNFCEFWRVQPEQIQGTDCFPGSPTAGLSYLLVEMWLAASWNTTGTSPQWDTVSLDVYRMSNMDDIKWNSRKAYSYGYHRYLDKTNGAAYHRVIVSTYQAPGAAVRDNTTISNSFQKDPWFLSVNNADRSRSSNGYTLKVSCVNPNTLPCPAAAPDQNECTGRGLCQTNSTVGKAPLNSCKCTGETNGYACQTSTSGVTQDPMAQYGKDTSSTTEMLLDPMGAPSSSSSSSKKKSWDKRILLVLLLIPLGIAGWMVYNKFSASRKRNQQVCDEEPVKVAQPTKSFQQLHHV